MKKVLILIALISLTHTYAQDDKFFDVGFVLGGNYSSTADLTVSGGIAGLNETVKSAKKMGVHGGLYFQFNFNEMYLRPEVLYTMTKTNYEDVDFDQTKIDVPVLYGFKIIGPVSMFAGPSFQYLLTSKLEDIDYKNIDVEKDLSVNAQVGIAVKFGKQIRLDVRYEKGISDNIITLKNSDVTDPLQYDINAKPEQFMVSLSLQL
jgi:hypothetical protein